MVDFHTHILPNMDDGSKSVSDSYRMMQCSALSGVKILVASPHYDRQSESVSAFLARREVEKDRLAAACASTSGLPSVLLGAEVGFYPSISETSDITELCVESTPLLLLEMPFEPWTMRTLNEVYNLVANRDVTPVIAHIERYFDSQRGTGNLESLIDMDVYLQVNSASFQDRKRVRQILRLIKKDSLLVLGSDCHNMADRPPNMSIAGEVIRKKLGNAYMETINQFSMKILEETREDEYR